MTTTPELIEFVREQLKSSDHLAGIHVEVCMSSDDTICVEHRRSLKSLFQKFTHYIDVRVLSQMHDWQKLSYLQWVAEVMAAKVDLHQRCDEWTWDKQPEADE